ncbi:MAG TPA: methyltransferase domain-containing protein [Actinomycetota bacterium]|nr:methyltransferase domain-containing protein [Actinomycetota bacterium]
MTGSVETFQLSVEAAEVYEASFVPALFAEWAPHLVEAAGVAPGQAVLDVACGTGVVARTAADRMGGKGRVVGLDLNEGMLTVARRLRPDIEWHQGDAGDLPFAAGSFDAVLCQSALMFFPDRAGALREMARVATPGGTVAVQVWDRLEAQEGFGAMYAAFSEHLGPEAAELESSYWALGDLDLMGSLFEAAGMRVTGTRTRVGTVRYPSATEAVTTELQATPLAERIGEDAQRRIVEAASEAMSPFVVDGGRVELPLRGHLITAARPT